MLRYSVLKYIEKASRLYNLAVRGNSEIYRVEEKLRISMSIHFRRGKEANRLACKPDVMRFRLGQSDKATCDEKKKRTHKKKNVCGNIRRVRCIPARRNYDQTAFRKPSREKYVAWRGQIWSIGREGKVWKRKKRKIYGNPTTAPRNKLDANHETLEFQMQRFRGMLVVQITLFIRLMHTPLITENQLESTDNYICVKFMEANIVVDR